MKQEVFTDQNKLIQSLKRGERQAWNYVYQQNYRMVAGLISKNSGSEDDIKDIYHYTMLELHRKAKDGQLEVLTCKLSSFIYAVARNRWLYRLRENNKIDKVIIDNIDLADEDTSVAENEQSLRRKAWEKSKAVLSEKCLGILQAFYLERQNMAAIATYFGLKDARSARVQKNKCMDKIKPEVRQQLRALGGEMS